MTRFHCNCCKHVPIADYGSHPKAEEFYFVVEGRGPIRVGDETLTVPKYGGVLVGPKVLRQVSMTLMK